MKFEDLKVGVRFLDDGHMLSEVVSREVRDDGVVVVRLRYFPSWGEPGERSLFDNLTRHHKMVELFRPLAADPVSAPAAPARETVLEEAARIVDGPRRTTYGHPRDNHARTAAIWTAQLSAKLRPGEVITPREVCLLMAGVKLSREAHAPHRDNLVDLGGWARNAEIVSDEGEVAA